MRKVTSQIDVFINESKQSDVVSIITEELGIANKTIDVSKELINKILNQFKNKNYTRTEIKKDVFLCQFDFQYNVNDLLINVFCKIYNFKNKETYEKYKDYDLNSGNIRKLTNEYNLSLVGNAISGKMDIGGLSDTIHHEISHIWQEVNAPKQIVSDDYYNKITNYIFSKDVTEQMIGWCLYYSLDYEQSAFANGLYGQLMNSMTDFDMTLQNSEAFYAYRKFNEFLNYIENLTNNTEIEYKLQNDFKLTLPRLLKKIKTSRNLFLRKIARAMIKASDEIKKHTRY